MGYSFDNARREWSDEVDAEAARLVREFGIPPLDALDQAKKNIARRRSDATFKRQMESLRPPTLRREEPR